MLKAQSLADYLDELSSRHPTPGGGSAAALTAAQGAALLSMVCNLTIGKARFADVEVEMRSILAVLEQRRAHLLDLAEQDVNVFQSVMAAYGLPKRMEKEVLVRDNAVQAALKNAAEVPFELFETCFGLLPIADRLELIANPAVMSDVAVGRHLLIASLLSAKANVDINLASITDATFCERKLHKMRDRLANPIYLSYYDNCTQTNVSSH